MDISSGISRGIENGRRGFNLEAIDCEWLYRDERCSSLVVLENGNCEQHRSVLIPNTVGSRHNHYIFDSIISFIEEHCIKE